MKQKGFHLAKSILITGCSSGLGLALTNLYLDEGFIVYGISKTKPSITNKNFNFKNLDLSQTFTIKKELSTFIKSIKNLDIVFLNAGVLGEIKRIVDISLSEIQKVMNINVYANKEILDILSVYKARLIIAISSGASKNGSLGWGAYSLSKSNLNMLINIYSKEILQSKLLSVAPGVIKTPMTDIIRFDIDENKFPSAKVLKNAPLQTPKEAAIRLKELCLRENELETGSFVDVRNI